MSVTLLLTALLHAPQVTQTPPQGADTLRVAIVADSLTAAVSATADTIPRRRPKAVTVSDAYALRLRIHYLTSLTTVPLFVLQSVSGNQLYQSGGPDPAWASSLHSLSAAGLGTAFTINTVTGLWNLWESRDNADGRIKRLLHSGLLLASDAGFTYAGVKLGSEAKHSQSARDQHRRIAYISMSTALVGYGIMLVGDH